MQQLYNLIRRQSEDQIQLVRTEGCKRDIFIFVGQEEIQIVQRKSFIYLFLKSIQPSRGMDSEEEEYLFQGHYSPFLQTKVRQDETLESDKRQQPHNLIVPEIAHVYSVLVVRELKEDKKQREIDELIENLGLSRWMDGHDEILLRQMVSILESQFNCVMEGCQIMLFSVSAEMYVNFGLHPFLGNTKVNLSEYVSQNQIKVKIKKVQQCNLLHLEMLKDTNKHMINGPPKLLEKQETTEEGQPKRSKRSIKNFQKIGYIVKKVLGLKAKQKKFQIISFDHHLKNDRQMTKKSIEDYYCQIRLGYKYNFDFNENRGKDMKLLRQFVRRKSLADVNRIPRKKKSKHSEQLSKSQSLVDSSLKQEAQIKG